MQVDEVIDHQEVEQEAEQKVEVSEEETQQVDEVEEVEEQVEKQVPLAVLQRERKKRQEAEMNANWQYQQLMELKNKSVQEPEDNPEEYESATKQELKAAKLEVKREAIREIKEEIWVDSNPEKVEFVEKNLDEFLKKRPQYADVIKSSGNRYKEGYDLIKGLMLPNKPPAKAREAKREAPNSPSTVPKMAAMKDSVDVMSMDDKEYREWRASKRRR